MENQLFVKLLDTPFETFVCHAKLHTSAAILGNYHDGCNEFVYGHGHLVTNPRPVIKITVFKV
jgi:hypothetical protein